jgi:hypothetical protein
MADDVSDWRRLHRCEDLRGARAVATSIAAMEFEVRVRDLISGVLVDVVDDELTGPFAIEVRGADWADLADVLDELIDEQETFDAFVDGWHARSTRAMRIVLAAVVLIIALLAILGVFDI